MLYKVTYSVEAYVEADSEAEAEELVCEDDMYELRTVTTCNVEVAPADTDLDLLFYAGGKE